jgi:hypothetical protein
MFITKKHISRRAVLRGAGVALALPFLDSMVPAQTPLRKTAAVPKTRFTGIFVPHGMAPGYWIPEKPVLEAGNYPFIMKPLEAFRDRTVVLSGLWSKSAEPPPGVKRGRTTGWPRHILCAQQTEEDHRRGYLRRHHHRSDHRAARSARKRCCHRCNLRLKIQARIPATAAKAIAAPIRTTISWSHPRSRCPWNSIRKRCSSAFRRGRNRVRRKSGAPGAGSQHSGFGITEPDPVQERSQRRRSRQAGRVPKPTFANWSGGWSLPRRLRARCRTMAWWSPPVFRNRSTNT